MTEQPSNERVVDVQIVGGGIAGLVAAAVASSAGRSVRVIEKQSSPGGRATTTERDGFRLNHGPHALYCGGDLTRALASIDIRPQGIVPDQTGSIGTMGGRTGRLPVGLTSLLRTGLLSLRSKRRLASLLGDGLRSHDPGELGSIAVDDWLDELSQGRRDLADVLRATTTLVSYNRATDIASADAALVNLQLALADGVIYVDGGWATIVDALRARLGADAFATAEATEVVPSPNATLVRTADGRSLQAGATIIASGLPATVDRLLGTGDRYASLAGPPIDASVLDMGLCRPPTTTFHLDGDDGLYASVHSGADGVAPDGSTLFSLARYRRPGDDMSVVDTRGMLTRFAARCGVSREHVTFERYLHRMVVTGGMPLADRGGMPARPSTTVPGHARLFVAGDWVGPRGVLADAAAASAEDAAAAAIAITAERSATMVA